MNYKRVGVSSLAIFLLVVAYGPAFSEDVHYSDFLSDYSKLQKSSDEYMDYKFLAPGAPDKMTNYTAVMIDQPEIFIASNSKYKGMKPDDMKALADAFRSSMAQAFAGTYMVVDQAGPNVLYLRFAISNLQLKKHKRGLLGYTPIGFVAGAAKSAMTSDITKKIDLKGLTMEMEVLGSNGKEQLAAVVETRSGKKDEPASWDELEALIDVYSQRVVCNLDNASLAEETRVDCVSGM
jgi:hypothetical protein